jgi:hypothetical protein
MSIYQIKTITFSLYGDGVSTQYQVDLAAYLPGVNNFSLIAAYTLSQQTVTQGNNTTVYEVATNLTATLVGTILNVNLSSAPPAWLEPYAGPKAVPFSFSVTVSFNG